ncbi:MAG: PorP/SprF family type IX secretion system membrane protein [Bacteroidales bacterium]|nr:PorP/SprF family type IX secretion system membrane protein [Bacteroidales bacterium]
MKQFTKALIIVIFIFSNINLNSQNLFNYSLFNQNPEIYNPSAILNDDIASFYFTSRLQWAGVDGFPKYNSMGASYSISPKMRLGMSLFNSTHGVFNNLKAKVNYAYRAMFSDKHYITFGLSLGIINNKILMSQLEYVDLSDELVQPDYYNKTSITSSFGVSYTINNFEAQLVLPQLFEYNKLNFYGIGIFSCKFKSDKKLSFKPSVLIRNTELVKVQADAVINIEWMKKLWVQTGVRSNGCLFFGVGNQTIAYAYETPVNNFSGVTLGSHEILVRFRIKQDKTCPAYNF